MKKFITLLLSASLLAGCASMSEEECATASWYDIGYESAIFGRLKSANERDFKACEKHEIPANIGLYDQGYSTGLNEFCTASNGASWGQQGKPYYNQCPAAREPAFLREYKPAFALSQAEQQLQSARNKLSNAENRIADLPSKILKAKQDVAFFTNSSFHLEALQALQSEQQTLKNQLPNLLANVTEAKSAVNSVKACDSPYDIGLDDALAGMPANTVSKRANTCRTYERPIDSREYLRGYDSGLTRFCTDTKAQELGQLGSAYDGQCSEVNPDFARQYNISRYDSELSDNYLKAENLWLEAQVAVAKSDDTITDLLQKITEATDLETIELLQAQLSATREIKITQQQTLAATNIEKNEQALNLDRFNQCKIGDWYTLGLIDGDAGKGYSALGGYQQSCGQFGLMVDTQAYRRGLSDALGRYCTPENGFLSGRNGEPMTDHCPSQMRLEYQRAYQDGARYQTLTTLREQDQQQIFAVEKQLQGLAKQIRTTQDKLANELKPSTRQQLEYDLSILNQRKIALSDQLQALQRQLADRDRSIQQIERRYPVVVL